jgi:Asp-tRNA(Asn)/Glu-tRNA(Gln) amidotransferase A subunit family amidase
MATQARITSTDALELFRASLIVFLGKANRSVDDVSDEVRRMRMWLQHDQRMHWEGEFRRRTKLLEQAQAELMSAQITSNQTSVLVRQAAVIKAKRALSEAEVKLRVLKKWSQNYDSSVGPAVKRLESLREYLTTDLPKAIAYLVNVQKTLDAYSSARVPTADTVSAPAAAAAPAVSEATQP